MIVVERVRTRLGSGSGGRNSLEHGRRDFIWPKTAKKLADALGVDPGNLYH